MLERIDDRLLPLRADAPARLQAAIDVVAPMRAGSIRGDGGNRHEYLLSAHLLPACAQVCPGSPPMVDEIDHHTPTRAETAASPSRSTRKRRNRANPKQHPP